MGHRVRLRSATGKFGQLARTGKGPQSARKGKAAGEMRPVEVHGIGAPSKKPYRPSGIGAVVQRPFSKPAARLKDIGLDIAVARGSAKIVKSTNVTDDLVELVLQVHGEPIVLRVKHAVQAIAPAGRGRQLPEVSRALEAEASDLASIEHEFGYLDSKGVAERLGARSLNRNFASAKRARGELLGYSRRGQQAVRYPKFQFDAHGVLPVIKDLLGVASESQVAQEDLLFWLAAPSGMLDDDARPVDMLRNDPEAVLKAARYDLGEHAW